MDVNELSDTNDWKYNEKEVVIDGTCGRSNLVNTSKKPRSRGSPQSCPICGLIISNAYNFSCHLRRHNTDKPFKCSQCTASFILQHELKLHAIVHSNILNFKCSLCPKSFKTKSGRRGHEDSHGINEYTCHYCEEKFTKFTDRGKHESSVHRKGEFKCSYCYKVFASQEFKLAHESVVHKKSDKPQLRQIKRVHIKTKDSLNLEHNSPDKKSKKPFFKCKICSERFTFRKDQLAHIYNDHPNHADKALRTCNICGKKFTGYFFWYHMNAHKGLKPHACTLCDYKTARKGELNAHMIVHLDLDKAPYKCTQCGRKFKCKRSVELCEAKHKGKKELCCSICDRTFFTSNVLSRHIAQVHSKQKCEICNMEIALFYYKLHMKKEHSENENFKKCEKCGRCYSNISNYNRHIRTHASNETVKQRKPTKSRCCPYCDNVSPNTKHLLKHCSTMHPTKVYKCVICPYASLSIIKYNKHIKVHVNDSSYEIFFSFNLESSLTNVQEYPVQECFICGFQSAFEFKMNEHLETHEATFKKYGCLVSKINDCDFVRKSYVTKVLKWRIKEDYTLNNFVSKGDYSAEEFQFENNDNSKIEGDIQLELSPNAALLPLFEESPIKILTTVKVETDIKLEENRNPDIYKPKLENGELLFPLCSKNKFYLNANKIKKVKYAEISTSANAKPPEVVSSDIKINHLDLASKLHVIDGKKFIALEDVCHFSKVDINSFFKQIESVDNAEKV